MFFKRTVLWGISQQQLAHYASVGLPIAGSLLAACLLIQIGDVLSGVKRPEDWEFRHRIKAAGYSHGHPQFTYLFRGRTRHLPHTGAIARRLQDGDSISKRRGSREVLVMRDSLTFRTRTTWRWSETEQDFYVSRRVQKRLR